MHIQEFFPTDVISVQLIFTCIQCQEEIQSEPISVPEPYWGAEKASDSNRTNWNDVICKECSAEYGVSVSAGLGGGFITIEKLEENSEVEIIENYYDFIDDEFDAIISNTEFYRTFQNNLYNLENLNDMNIFDAGIEALLKKQIWVSLITALETYLSDALITTIFTHEEYKRKFVERYKVFQKRKFMLSEIYKESDKLDQIIKRELFEIVYHKIPKVEKIYEAIFDVNFGDIEKIQIAINKRHDIVHRNGKTKDGHDIKITHDEISYFIGDVRIFVENIDGKLKTSLEFR